MSFEQYTLILQHDWVQKTPKGDERIRIEEPLVMRYSVNRAMAPGPAVILSYMMDDFKQEILNRIEREEKSKC